MHFSLLPSRTLVLFGSLSLFAILTGCVTTTIQSHTDFISITQAKSDIDANIGEAIRWGGTVASIKNDPEYTMVEIVARPLNRSGRPKIQERSSGRFIAKVEGFLEPETYGKSSIVSVTGSISDTLTAKIDEYDYTYPVIAVEEIKIWPKIVPKRRYPHNWMDPWYHPWGYPFLPRPYRPHLHPSRYYYE